MTNDQWRVLAVLLLVYTAETVRSCWLYVMIDGSSNFRIFFPFLPRSAILFWIDTGLFETQGRRENF